MLSSKNTDLPSFDDFIQQFRAALASGCNKIILNLWSANPLLSQWYSGGPVQFGNDPSGQPDIHAITLDSSESISLLKSVLTASNQGSYKLLRLYLSNLDDSMVIRTVLEELQKSCVKRKTVKMNQIAVLEKRLQELEV